jgi:RimJ/RimL family protein N-acetyltransferase
MGYPSDQTGDYDKLMAALGDLTGKFGSVQDVLEAFGLADLPLAQRYGILFGFLTFFCTVSAVLLLLVYGGSFRRMAEQADTGHATLAAPHDARAQRPLLLESLLASRQRMMDSNYPSAPATTEKPTPLTQMLLNLSPPKEDKRRGQDKNQTASAATLVETYKKDYVLAYRTCQDKMGGPALSGRPEARFEAYARSYASCGPTFTISNAYRRSYARIYESLACATHASDDKYAKLWQDRPQDIVGKYVRLEALEVDRHLQSLYQVTSGQPTMGNSNYNPQEIWSFVPEGPFASPQRMRQSSVFQHKMNEAAFAIVHSVTDQLIGAIKLTRDEPENLSIQLEAPFVQPALEGTPEQLEACFLLLDRLFAYGYRRVQISVDAQDARRRKLAVRLGCTLEGTLSRHMIVKESSRDSAIFSLVNSDWKAGARTALFAKFYGKAVAAADLQNEQKSAELEEQNKFLEAERQASKQQ